MMVEDYFYPRSGIFKKKKKIGMGRGGGEVKPEIFFYGLTPPPTSLSLYVLGNGKSESNEI